MSVDKPSIVVILGPTGVGKSRLAIDIAQYIPAEIINSDSMQVYKGLDVLTNKVPLEERRGIPHHLLGIIDPKEEFTARHFRDLAVSKIDEILQRKRLPIIVGGTNYYIQALVSSYLLDDYISNDHCHAEGKYSGFNMKGTFVLESLSRSEKERIDVDQSWRLSNSSQSLPLHDQVILDTVKTCDASNSVARQEVESCKQRKDANTFMAFSPNSTESRISVHGCDAFSENAKDRLNMESGSIHYEWLKEIDPQAACRLHPNDLRKVKQYLKIYGQTGRKPSDLFQGAESKKWGTLDTLRYNCCFLLLDAETPILDKVVANRVDSMVQTGLLDEVSRFYIPGAKYTRGLCQAIGVAEFCCLFDTFPFIMEERKGSVLQGEKLNLYNAMVASGVQKMKNKTCKLVRHQKRRLSKLESRFGWQLYHVDVTDVLQKDDCQVDNLWQCTALLPAMEKVKQFLNHISEGKDSFVDLNSRYNQRGLWMQFVCEACGGHLLQGEHQWKEHTSGRAHRKRVASLRRNAHSIRNGENL